MAGRNPNTRQRGPLGHPTDNKNKDANGEIYIKWGFQGSGDYTVKEAYSLASTPQTNQNEVSGSLEQLPMAQSNLLPLAGC